MNTGYLQSTYWHTAYFTEDYFQVWGAITPTTGAGHKHDDHRRRSRMAANVTLVGRM